MKNAIIYLHGFNSASLDLSGHLLVAKHKLAVLDDFCRQHQIKFCTPNIDYRQYDQVIEDFARLFIELKGQGYNVVFMGSSLGGFSSEYLAMKMQAKAIMINPALLPSELLRQYIGVEENFEIKQPFDWSESHCQQFKAYEIELKKNSASPISMTVFLDRGDELLDVSMSYEKYKDIAQVFVYEGGSHSFEHTEDVLPVLEKVIVNG